MNAKDAFDLEEKGRTKVRYGGREVVVYSDGAYTHAVLAEHWDDCGFEANDDEEQQAANYDAWNRASDQWVDDLTAIEAAWRLGVSTIHSADGSCSSLESDTHGACRAIARAHSGEHHTSSSFARDAERVNWDNVWPIIDREGDLTGEISEGDNCYNVDDVAMIEHDEARAGGWTISDGYAEAPQPIDVELATCCETIRHCAVEEFTGLEHPAMEAACQAYHSAVVEALAGDPRAKRLNVVSPKGQRLLHSQWCGAHFSWARGAMGVMSDSLTAREKAAIEAADEAGRAAAKNEVDAEEAAAAEPTRQQIAALQDEAGMAGDDAMASICAAALDGDPVALAEVARCLRDAAAQCD